MQVLCRPTSPLERSVFHMCKVFSWNMTYGSGRTLRITGELVFLDFRKQLQISSITRTNMHNLIYHIYTHNNLDLDQA